MPLVDKGDGASGPAPQGSERDRLRTLAAGALRQIGAALAGLLTYPIVARVLDDEGLGAWAIIGSASFLPLLCDLGLTTAVQRAAVTADHERTRRALALATLSVTVLVPFTVVILYLFFLDIPGASAALRADVSRAALVTLGSGVLAAYIAPFRGFVIARGGVKSVATARMVASLTQVTIVACGIILPRTLLIPAAGVLAGQFFEGLITFRAARHLDPLLPLLPRRPRNLREALHDLRDGAATLVSSAAAVVAVRVDVLVLSRVASLAEVGAYGVAGRAVDQAYVIANQGTVALMPRLGDPSQREQALRMGTVIFAGVVVSGMAALALDGQGLLVAWVGPVAAGAITARTAILLGTAAAILSLQEVASSMLVLGGRTAWQAAVPRAIGSLFNLSISLAGASRWGIWAVAGSTVAGNLVQTVLTWRRARRLVAWSPLALIGALAPIFAAAAVSGGVGFALARSARGGTAASILCCGVTMALGGGACLLSARWARRRSHRPVQSGPESH